jgi:hypothetical protein
MQTYFILVIGIAMVVFALPLGRASAQFQAISTPHKVPSFPFMILSLCLGLTLTYLSIAKLAKEDKNTESKDTVSAQSE